MPAGDALLIPRRHLRHRPEASGGPLDGQELAVGELLAVAIATARLRPPIRVQG